MSWHEPSVASAREQAGFTLIEIVLSITLLSALAGMGFHLFFNVGEVVFESESTAGHRNAARIAFERFRADVQAIESASSTDITQMTSSSFRFRRTDGEWVQYDVSGNTLQRDGKDLLYDAASASFGFLTSGGGTAVNPEDMYRVALELQLGVGAASPVEMATEVTLRSRGYTGWQELEAGL